MIASPARNRAGFHRSAKMPARGVSTRLGSSPSMATVEVISADPVRLSAYSGTAMSRPHRVTSVKKLAAQSREKVGCLTGG